MLCPDCESLGERRLAEEVGYDGRPNSSGNDVISPELFRCSKCNKTYGRCLSCSESAFFENVVFYDVSDREILNRTEEEWKEKGIEGRDLSMCLDEEKVDQLISENPGCSKVVTPYPEGHPLSGKGSIELRVPIGIDLGITPMMSSEAVGAEVCSNCDESCHLDIHWHG
jgi:hypothetical protein